jgi:hypothetical protein
MRIVDASSDLLVVTEPATGVRTSGAAVALAGAAILAAGITANSVAAGIAGSVTLIIGGLFTALPAITKFSFQRRDDRLVIERRRLWQPQPIDEHYSLRDVSAVQVDESRSSDGDGGSTWRVVVRLNDGRVLPFTSYYTSGFQAKADVAERIRVFLELAPVTRSFGGRSSPHAIVPPSRKTTIGIAVVIALMGVLFGSIGGVMLAREVRRLSTWQPVEATVLRTRVDIRTDSDGSTYAPIVTYRYSVNDRDYTSSGTLPVNESRSGSWAYRVVARFRPGERYTAWYDPESPADAFIVRSHSIVAPIFTAIGAIAVVAGLGIGMSARREREL